MATGLCLLAAALTLPTGILLERYEESMSTESNLATELVERREEVEGDLNQTRVILDHLAKDTPTRGFSTLIADIDKLAEEEVTLTHFNFDDKEKLILSGIAVSRASLSNFRSRLEAHREFKKVELPLSSLVKDNDVPFSITITMRSI